MPFARFKWGDFVLLFSPNHVVAIRKDSLGGTDVKLLDPEGFHFAKDDPTAIAIWEDMVEAHGMAKAQRAGIEALLEGVETGGREQ
jgi:hypothetical protein